MFKVVVKTKKYRDIYSKYILEGIKLVDEISSGNNVPELIVYSEELLNKIAVFQVEKAKKRDTACYTVADV